MSGASDDDEEEEDEHVECMHTCGDYGDQLQRKEKQLT